MEPSAAKRKILVTRNNAYLLGRLAQHPWIDVDCFDQSASAIPPVELEARAKNCAGIICMISDKISAKVLDSAGPSLKVVSTISVGFDHIDVAICRERGILVGHTPGCLHESTAELAVALTFAAKRRLFESHVGARHGEWGVVQMYQFCGTDVSRNTIGVIGMGEIGLTYARFMHRGFNCRILYTGPREKPNDVDAEFVDLEALLRRSDVVSIHSPLNEQTAGMLNATTFAMMQPHAVLINTARGGIVDQDALVHALTVGKIAAAALDVTVPEPLPLDHRLYDLPNCIVVPHIGAATVETRHRMVDRAVDNLLAGLTTSSLPYPIPSVQH
ncbi:hypothetical protein, variant [Aphanomyces invadans]|uniref:Uncharacterized protein n=2 Tax=Aphanomyces invadans TaxID=157072 RepID=A0A024UTH0_9STRA|nr:hypothetical protein, variant [Aphanomyces invadans]ETW08908.1 hypothetical protein, variant [Aphanomyces invadans]|eukprot:XP_008862713.1 hypothetical protein, variant [Aphanomyces invadans]